MHPCNIILLFLHILVALNHTKTHAILFYLFLTLMDLSRLVYSWIFVRVFLWLINFLKTICLYDSLILALNISYFLWVPKKCIIHEVKLFDGYSLLVSFCSLLVNFCLLLVSFCSVLVTFCSLLVTFCSLLVTFCSLLVNFCALQVTFCSFFNKTF